MLLADEDHDIRINGLEIFKFAAESCPNLRKFELPKVNFAAKNLIELLDDATSVWYMPPLLKGTSLQAVESVIWTGKADSLKVLCHDVQQPDYDMGPLMNLLYLSKYL